MKPKKILISVGEASGDLHGANLVRKVLAIEPQCSFQGMGGVLMRNAGVKILADISKTAIIGATGIITNFLHIFRALQLMKKALKNDKPDLVILIDYAGFNLKLAKYAKRSGIKVLYYISPKIWAWHQSRIKIIQKYVDIMAVIFPFEVAFYKQFSVPVKFVGNPLIELVKPTMSLQQAKEQFNLTDAPKIIGLMPGSRHGEIEKLLPIMLEAAKILHIKYPESKFILPLATSISMSEVEPYLSCSCLPIKVLHDNVYNIIQMCDAIIAASGTAILEITLLKIPVVLIYKLSFINYVLAKHLIKIPYAGLCNIIANKRIIKELLQYDATPEKIAAEIIEILENKTYREQMLAEFTEVRNNLLNYPKTDITELIFY
jgi:lipid-A-disaccharide synthase